MAEEPQIPFEDALARLEKIAQQLDEGRLPLNESVALYEEGRKLLRQCDAQLTEARGRIEALVKRSDATVEREPFSV